MSQVREMKKNCVPVLERGKVTTRMPFYNIRAVIHNLNIRAVISTSGSGGIILVITSKIEFDVPVRKASKNTTIHNAPNFYSSG